MNHPRALFLGTLAVILILVAMVVYDMDPLVFWLGLVWMVTARAVLKGYTAYLAARSELHTWQAHNPKRAKAARTARADLRVVRGSDGSGRRVMV